VNVGPERLVRRAAAAGVLLSPELADRLLVYLRLLWQWNRRVNLTGFDLSEPRDEALDRLVIEPVAAATLMRAGDRRVVDIGSGGGSPAIPLALAVPSIEMTLVEVRAKKAAFLREVIRTLGLPASVEVTRAEEFAAATAVGRFDVVTFRAVRADQELWRAVDRLLVPDGRVLWFGGFGHMGEFEFSVVEAVGSTAALERT
jgi:16S rRNA (guanine527-N7)-methyltransferase